MSNDYKSTLLMPKTDFPMRGNLGNNDTHYNITIITGAINITSVLLEDNVTLPVDEIDLAAGVLRTVNCNITVEDPEFPPIGWYRIKDEYGLFFCTEEELAIA